MDGHTAVFTTMLPIIRIEGGLAFLVVNAAGHEVCTTLHNIEVFHASLGKAIRKFHASLVEPVPLPSGRRKKRRKRGKG